MAQLPRHAKLQLGSAPWVAWTLAVGFFGVGVWAARTDRFLHDEGMLSWFFAEFMANETVATLFFLKARPPLAIAYAPIAGWGLDAFLVVHVLVAALAIPLAAAVARALGHGAANLVALAIALSPMMLAAAPAGVGNTDVVVGLLLSLYLLVVRKRPGWAGIVAGALPLVRAEISIFVLALAVWSLWYGFIRRRPTIGLQPGQIRRFALGLPAVGLGLALAGVGYHRELLWFVHYPPTIVVPTGATEVNLIHASAGQMVVELLSIAPLCGLLLLISWRRLRSIERTVVAAGILFVLAIRGLPFVGLFHFDDSPRYALPMILLMLPLGRLADVWHEGEDSGVWASLGFAALLLTGVAIHQRPQGNPGLVYAVAGWSFIWGLGRLAGPGVSSKLHKQISTLALVATFGLAVAAAATPQLTAATRLQSDAHARRHQVFSQWVSSDPACVRNCRIITNVHLLTTWARRRGLLDAGVEIEHLVTPDIEAELRALTNPENGQFEVLLEQMRSHYYGTPLLASELAPERLQGDVVFVLRPGDRLRSVMDPDVWEPQLTTIVEAEGLRIAKFQPPG